MEFVTVRGQLTLEETDAHIYLGRAEMRRLSAVMPRADERDHYQKLANQLDAEVFNRREDSDRAIVVANQPNRDTKSHCITLIQLLMGRAVNVMGVYMRASSTRRLGSDLGFLSRLGIQHNVDEVDITVGSFHVELLPEEI